MNDKKKLIELFTYIVIVVVGIILLITSNANVTDKGGSSYVIVSGK